LRAPFRFACRRGVADSALSSVYQGWRRFVNSDVDEHRAECVNMSVDWSRPRFYGWAVGVQTLLHEQPERVATVPLNPSEPRSALRLKRGDELDPVPDAPGRPREFALARRPYREGLVP
jgi:hypothetical protein